MANAGIGNIVIEACSVTPCTTASLTPATTKRPTDVRPRSSTWVGVDHRRASEDIAASLAELPDDLLRRLPRPLHPKSLLSLAKPPQSTTETLIAPRPVFGGHTMYYDVGACFGPGVMREPLLQPP